MLLLDITAVLNLPGLAPPGTRIEVDPKVLWKFSKIPLIAALN